MLYVIFTLLFFTGIHNNDNGYNILRVEKYTNSEGEYVDCNIFRCDKSSDIHSFSLILMLTGFTGMMLMVIIGLIEMKECEKRVMNFHTLVDANEKPKSKNAKKQSKSG